MLTFRIKDESSKSSENPSYRRLPFMAKLALFSSVFFLSGVKWGFLRLWGQNFKGVILGLYIGAVCIVSMGGYYVHRGGFRIRSIIGRF